MNSKRFIVTLLALLIWTLLVWIAKFDLILTSSALAVIIGPYLTVESIRKSTSGDHREV